jgi:hypothetical protein
METSSTCYIVLEYCNEGDLESFVQGNKGWIPEEEAVGFLL